MLERCKDSKALQPLPNKFPIRGQIKAELLFKIKLALSS